MRILAIFFLIATFAQSFDVQAGHSSPGQSKLTVYVPRGNSGDDDYDYSRTGNEGHNPSMADRLRSTVSGQREDDGNDNDSQRPLQESGWVAQWAADLESLQKRIQSERELLDDQLRRLGEEIKHDKAKLAAMEASLDLQKRVNGNSITPLLESLRNDIESYRTRLADKESLVYTLKTSTQDRWRTEEMSLRQQALRQQELSPNPTLNDSTDGSSQPAQGSFDQEESVKDAIKRSVSTYAHEQGEREKRERKYEADLARAMQLSRKDAQRISDGAAARAVASDIDDTVSNPATTSFLVRGRPVDPEVVGFVAPEWESNPNVTPQDLDEGSKMRAEAAQRELVLMNQRSNPPSTATVIMPEERSDTPTVAARKTDSPRAGNFRSDIPNIDLFKDRTTPDFNNELFSAAPSAVTSTVPSAAPSAASSRRSSRASSRNASDEDNDDPQAGHSRLRALTRLTDAVAKSRKHENDQATTLPEAQGQTAAAPAESEDSQVRENARRQAAQGAEADDTKLFRAHQLYLYMQHIKNQHEELVKKYHEDLKKASPNIPQSLKNDFEKSEKEIVENFMIHLQKAIDEELLHLYHFTSLWPTIFNKSDTSTIFNVKDFPNERYKKIREDWSTRWKSTHPKL